MSPWWRGCPRSSGTMWRLLGAAALLLLVPCHTLADHPKAVVVLDPPWDRVLEKDRVELRCQGPHDPGDKVTKWWHNGSAMAQEAASLVIVAASTSNSGEYSCQTGLSAPSDPQSLEVHKGWLLLQALSWVVRVGDPIRMRCNSWKNFSVSNVIYFHNGQGRKFFYKNTELLIPAAAPADSGIYFCRGLIEGKRNESSGTARFLVEDPSAPPHSAPPRSAPPSSAPPPSAPPPSAPPSFMPSPSPLYAAWHRILLSLAVGLLFVVNTGLYLSMWRDLRRLRNKKIRWSRDPQDK